MGSGAQTPEELASLLEDAFVARDGEALACLFEDGAVVAAGEPVVQARGAGQIARLASSIWARELTCLAEARQVLQARDTALVVVSGGLSVLRRGPDRGWRFSISLIEPM